MTMLQDAIRKALEADVAFEVAIQRAGYKSRWAWSAASLDTRPLDAYRRKVACDRDLDRAFADQRELMRISRATPAKIAAPVQSGHNTNHCGVSNRTTPALVAGRAC
jgi:hypothetical protein